MVWPVHCVQDTKGSEFPPEFTGSSKITSLIKKGYLMDREYYSAFQDVWHLHQTELNSVLRENEITDVFIVGLALDYCVYNTAIDSVTFGYTTHIIKEGTKPVDPDAWDPITAKLQAKGINIIDLDNSLIEKVKEP